jgi:hypothetical protein
MMMVMKADVKKSSRLMRRVIFFLPEAVIDYHHVSEKSILAG